MTKNTITLGVLGGIGIIALTSGLFSVSVNAQTDIQERIDDARERINEAVIARCDIVESRIDLATTRFQENKERHIQGYNEINDVTQSYVDYAQEQGVDTANLETQLTELDNLVRTFSSETIEYQDALEATKNSVCGESESQFLEDLNTARKEYLDVREASVKVRQHVQDNLLPAIEEVSNEINN